MFTRVELSNFKAHADLDVKPLGPLTVLVGRNNSGKSTVLHALAIPKYGFRRDPHLPIGTEADLRTDPAKQTVVRIHLEGVADPLIVETTGGGYGMKWSGGLSEESRAKADHLVRNVFYISALRTVRETFGYQEFSEDVGVTGDKTWHILHNLKANDDHRFAAVVKALAGMGMGITSLGVPTVSSGQGAVMPESYGRRTNLVLQGSGVWAVLPIVTQGVLASKRSALLVEEPESHLHRAAVDGLWEFFGDCAKRGVQIICTTHSLDLVASMSERVERGMLPENSTLLHLQRNKDGKTSAAAVDLSVFRKIRENVKKDLAGYDL